MPRRFRKPFPLSALRSAWTALRGKVTCAVAILLGACALFLYSGSAKLQQRDNFIAAIESQGLIPTGLASPAAWGIITAELLLPLLALDALVRAGSTTRASILLACLCIAIGAYAMCLVIWPPPEPAPCGFGDKPVQSWVWIAARTFLAAAALGLVPALDKPTMPRPSSRTDPTPLTPPYPCRRPHRCPGRCRRCTSIKRP